MRGALACEFANPTEGNMRTTMSTIFENSRLEAVENFFKV
jgi:hypothetical protein